MVTVVASLASITAGSDVVSITVKVWSPSNAPSSIMDTVTHLAALLADPEAKISREETAL